MTPNVLICPFMTNYIVHPKGNIVSQQQSYCANSHCALWDQTYKQCCLKTMASRQEYSSILEKVIQAKNKD